MGAHYTLTIDLPEPLFASLSRAAEMRGKNLATFAEETIMEKARGLAEDELAAAYDLLAADDDEVDVEPYFSAQAEVLGE